MSAFLFIGGPLDGQMREADGVMKHVAPVAFPSAVFKRERPFETIQTVTYVPVDMAVRHRSMKPPEWPLVVKVYVVESAMYGEAGPLGFLLNEYSQKASQCPSSTTPPK